MSLVLPDKVLVVLSKDQALGGWVILNTVSVLTGWWQRPPVQRYWGNHKLFALAFLLVEIGVVTIFVYMGQFSFKLTEEIAKSISTAVVMAFLYVHFFWDPTKE